MAIKAVVLAQKNGDGADVALPRTSADLVGYEKENSTATNVREALDEMNDNFQGEAPGIVRRVEVLEAKPDPTPESIGALAVNGTAVNAILWNGSAKTVSSAAPSGGADNDVWLQYI